MRRFLLALFLTLMTPLQLHAERMAVYAPGDGFLNLRTGPGTRFAVLRRMGHGSLVNTLELSGSWARVEHETGAVGWAHRRYMVPVSTPPAQRIVHSPGDGFLNLRTGPGTRYAVVRRMYNGSRVQVLESAGSWVRVRHDSGDTGWAHGRYLRR